ncbi:pickpocket protein 11-like [Trichogramma pretiosum]|uniref:pickpocket protein 11-like n=1 Tax=Trichogramma pretiosum TaxID=7493 RepID=UPI000C719120|nr:pickpocket protein 11-like [Trichogramma pretiosum]
MVHLSDYRSSSKILKVSLQKRSREFVLENSLHVIPYLLDPTKKIFERIWWLTVFTISVLAAILSIILIWNKFRSSPTLTYLYIDTENTVIKFPNFYLCFGDSYLNFTTFNFNSKQRNALRSLYKWKDINLFPDNEELKNIDLEKLFLKLTPECGDFFNECQFGNVPFLCGDLLTNKVSTANGICCELKNKTVYKADRFWNFKFRPRQYPISFFISGKYELPPFYGHLVNYNITGTTSIELSLTITSTSGSVQFLPQSQRKCVFEGESSEYTDCENTQYRAKMKANCGCVPWFDASSLLDVCSINEYKCLLEFFTRELSTSNCYVPCENTAYTYEKFDLSTLTVRPSEINIKKWPVVRFRRVTRFGWLDLVASFGGIAGFFTGYSIIATFEFVYYFTLHVYCGAVLAVPKIRFNVRPKYQ